MIEVKDCCEPLVDLALMCPELVIDLAPDLNGKKRKAVLRKSVAEMVCKAKSYLPAGMTFIIGDAWRPQEIQEDILRSFEVRFKNQHPEWSHARVIEEVDNYAAPSSGKFVSGHMTGAAVDLRLWRNGRKVPLKSKSLSYQENALPDKVKLPEYLRRNRQIMFDALEKAGLSHAKTEYWHWSYGDTQWAQRNDKKIAIYDKIELEI